MTEALRRKLLAIVLAAMPAVAAPLIAAPNDAADTAQRVAALAQQLTDHAASNEVRFDAAQKLAALSTVDSRKSLSDALVNFDENPRLAAARALALDAQPDVAQIEPLFVALGSGRRETVEAVAQALSRYSDNSDVLTRLIAAVQRPSANPVVRREITRVLGCFVEKRSARLLVQIFQDPNEAAALKTNADDALTAMTAAPDSANPDWNLWWQQHQNQSDADFRAGLLALRSQNLDLLRLHDSQRSVEVVGILREQYNAFQGATARNEVLMRYLKSADAAVRALGASIATDEGRLGLTVATNVRDQLRSMISDTDSDVRIGVATALAKINDPDALGQLQAQLLQEPDPDVKAALARALGVINDIKAVPQLLTLLGDPNPRVVQAAAAALNEQLAAQVQKADPQLAAAAADALAASFNRFRATPANEEVRQSLLQPMASLKQEKLLPLLNNLLAQQLSMSPGVKRLALTAIGNIASPQSIGAILTQLGDPDDSVRQAAVRALGSNPEAGNHAWELMSRVNPQYESNPAIQTDAWNAVSSLLNQLPVSQLQQFASQLAGQADRRLLVLRAEAKQLSDQRNLTELANVQENIGTALADLGRYAEAAGYFKSSLDAKKSQGVSQAAIDLLIGECMEASLRAKQYKEAIAFANQIDVDSRNLQLIGQKIFQEIARLQEPAQLDLDNARQLITEARTLSPPLGLSAQDDLSKTYNDILKKLGQKGGGPSGFNPPENANLPVADSSTASSR